MKIGREPGGLTPVGNVQKTGKRLLRGRAPLKKRLLRSRADDWKTIVCRTGWSAGFHSALVSRDGSSPADHWKAMVRPTGKTVNENG